MLRNMIVLSSVAFSSVAFSSVACAGYAGSVTLPLITESQLMYGLSVGPTWGFGNQSHTIYLEQDVAKRYTADHASPVFASVELFVGRQKLLTLPHTNKPVLNQIGLVLAGSGDVTLSGDVWEDADPDFNNFNYHYKVEHLHIAIQDRLIFHTNCFLEPYVMASVGIGFNRAYDFTIKPKISEEVPAPPFNSRTTTSFVYTLGLGVQHSFNTHIQTALGYEFASWGKTQLGHMPGQTLGHGITQNQLYANQIQFSLFYVV